MEQTSTTAAQVATYLATIDDVVAAVQIVTGKDAPTALWAVVRSWSVAEWLGAVETVGADEPDLPVVTAARDRVLRQAEAAALAPRA